MEGGGQCGDGEGSGVRSGGTGAAGAQAATVAILAMGTRGDVQPLALLAWKLSAQLVTHEAHTSWLRDLLPTGLRLAQPGLPHAPGTTWAGGQAAMPPTDSPAAREALLAATCAALGLPLLGQPQERGGGGRRGNGDGSAGGSGDGEGSTLRPRRLLLFNLFALEGWHIAEALGVPCAAAHPYMIPYACPASFGRRLEAAYPALAGRLRGAVGTGDGTVSWAEVQHWMWPLFTERWESFRQERLGLPPVPFLGAESLPPATPLLYGFSELVVIRPGHWPPSVLLTGFWLQAHLRQRHPELAAAWQLPADLAGFLGTGTDTGATTAGPPVVLVDFGSMGRLGLLPAPERLLAMLTRALELSEMRGVLMSGGWPPLEDVFEAQLPSRHASCACLHLHRGPLAAHDALLARCAAVLHHGGSGTVAAALAAGVPQVVAPQQFDQHYWGERLEHLGLTPPPLDRRVLSGQGGQWAGEGEDVEAAAATIAARLAEARSSQIVRRCADLAGRLQAPDECGLDRAERLAQQLSSTQPLP